MVSKWRSGQPSVPRVPQDKHHSKPAVLQRRPRLQILARKPKRQWAVCRQAHSLNGTYGLDTCGHCFDILKMDSSCRLSLICWPVERLVESVLICPYNEGKYQVLKVVTHGYLQMQNMLTSLPCQDA